jgi:hypothetical protein
MMCFTNIGKEDQDIQSQVEVDELDLKIEYWCQSKNCNSRSMAELIRKAVKDHYNMSAIYEVLKVKIEENSTITTISNEINTIDSVSSLTSTKETRMITSSSTKPTTIIKSTITTTEQPNDIATSLDISIILIIFNVLLFFFLN